MTIFKKFRDYGNSIARFNELSTRFDEPTYISFNLNFGTNPVNEYNGVGGMGFFSNYDTMPHPLFRVSEYTEINDRDSYSTMNYLLDANEFTRAKMLREFIIKLKTMQSEFPWYFQKIEGVDELLKTNPKNAMRVSPDKRLTITALEGIDLRMSHLLNLYRKIVYDDVYQRWVVPEMMRYFTLDIYMAEFRTFHKANIFNSLGERVNKSQTSELFLEVLDFVIPVWVIKCEMCEFDIENITYDHLSGLSIGDTPNTAGVKFQIKVGKIYEEQVYPTFQNSYLIDKKLNGFDRSKETEITGATTLNLGLGNVNVPTTGEYDSTNSESDNNKVLRTGYLDAAQITPYNEYSGHRSGASFNQMTNSKSLFGAKAAGKDGKLFSEDDKIAKVDSTEPNTWLGNAAKFGTAYGLNKLESFIDKAKLTEVPGLGISFNEVEAALQSKDIITSLGIIRKGITQVSKKFIEPSELLEGKIDNNFKLYLVNVVNSSATSGINKLLQSAANLALTDEGVWQKIKDYSMATDLVGPGEKNTNNPIEGGAIYKDTVDKTTGGDKSIATNLVGNNEKNVEKKINTIILESAPSSTATTNKLYKI